MEQVLTLEEWRKMVFDLGAKYGVTGVIFAGMSYGRYSATSEHYSYSANFLTEDICAAFDDSWKTAYNKLEAAFRRRIDYAVCKCCLQTIKTT